MPGEEKLLMHETDANQSDRLASVQQWVADHQASYDHHPYFADLVNRLQTIERLAQAVPCRQSGALPVGSIDGLGISLASMTLTMQLDRCEARIGMLQRGNTSGKALGAEQFQYPSISTAILQQTVQLIVSLKNRLGISSKTYSTNGLLQLCYIKAPYGLTRLISRILPRFW